MLVHILGALHPRSGVPIRHVLQMLWSSPGLRFKELVFIIVVLFIHMFLLNRIPDAAPLPPPLPSSPYPLPYPPPTGSFRVWTAYPKSFDLFFN
jgi:hypothetical protein